MPLLHDQIDRLKLEVSRLQLSQAVARGKRPIQRSAVRSARCGTEQVVRDIIYMRSERRRFLPAHLFADPAWDMLLDLYLSDIVSQRISVSSLCTASNVPATTALRWITSLQAEGLVERAGDPCDHRRYFMSLSKKGMAAMDGYFGEVGSQDN
jgi:DNA-binding MarR family transcriptional regulator